MERVLTEVRLAARTLSAWRLCFRSNIALLLSIAYWTGPIDLVPASIPVWGHLDELAALLIGVTAFRLLTPASIRVDLLDRGLTPRDATVAIRCVMREARLLGRLVARTAIAIAGARPLFRVAVGRWPDAKEAIQFRHGLVRHGSLPPVLRAMSNVPAARPHLTRAMLASWLTVDDVDRDRDMLGDGAAPVISAGDPTRVWSGPRIGFLHIRKTGGSSVALALVSRCHPLQLDIDGPTRDRLGEAVFIHPEILRRTRRCSVLSGHYDMPTLSRLDPDRFLFSIFRDPTRRIISMYEFLRSHDQPRLADGQRGARDLQLAREVDITTFLRSSEPSIRDLIDNHYVRVLTGSWASDADRGLADAKDVLSVALTALDNLRFVGLTEQLDASLNMLGRMLDVDLPAAAPRVNVTAENQRGASPTFRPIARVDISRAARAELERLTALDNVVYQAAVRRFEQMSANLRLGLRPKGPDTVPIPAVRKPPA